MDIQDSLIVDELKRGSDTGVRLMVNKYQDPLYRWGRWQYEKLNHQDLIEIIDDTFLLAIEKIDSFELKSEKGTDTYWRY